MSELEINKQVESAAKNKGISVLVIWTAVILFLIIAAASLYIFLNLTPEPKAESINAKEIIVSWKAVKNAELYNIYRMDDENGEYKKISTVKENKFTDSGLVQKSTHWYRIAVIKKGKEGKLSSPAKETTKPLPASPGNVSAEGTDFDKVTVKWDLIKDADKYYLYRSDANNDRFNKVGESTSDNFNDINLKSTSTYKYKISSVNSNGESEYSQIVEVTTKEKVNLRGNSGGNLSNYGLAAEQGDWIYYANKSRKGSLYKVRKDGTSLKKLIDGSVNNINVLGDWIYFSNGGMLCKMKTDGSSYTEYPNLNPFSFSIIGDWIFYNIHEGIYKMKTDGTEESLIASDNASGFYVEGDWIYYSNIPDKNSLYKIKIDGSSKTKLADDSSGFINLSGDWIYYRNYYDNQRIYKIKTDGTGRVKVSNDTVNYFNVNGDWIIFENWGVSGRLYKMKTDGTNRVELTTKHYNHISMIDSYIFYYDFNTLNLGIMQLFDSGSDRNNIIDGKSSSL